MTDVRKLLEEAYLSLDCVRQLTGTQYPVTEKIRAYLAEPEVKREALSEREMLHAMNHTHYFRSFEAGVRFAEKHHGVGGRDE